MSETRVCIVLGSGRGIGASIGRKLIENEWRVALCSRSLFRVPTEPSERTVMLSGDVRSEESMQFFISSIIAKWKRIDAIVHCSHEPFVLKAINDIKWEDYINQFEGCLKPVVLALKYALPHLKRTRGSILNLSSVTVNSPEKGFASRDTAKAAIEQFTRNAALECAPYGVRVNALSVGWTKTDQLKRLPISLQKKKQSEIPLGRFASPNEIAETACFLISDAATYITGVVFPVTGGLNPRVR